MSLTESNLWEPPRKETFGMDAQTILQLKPTLTRFLRQFDDCFARSQTRGHLLSLARRSLDP